MARPPIGVDHVEKLDGPEELKARLRVLLQTVTGELTTMQACARLGVGAARLHEMRREALEGALAALAPGRPGRPAKVEEASSREQALESEVKELKLALDAALTRTELAVAMPHLYLKGAKKNLKSRKRVGGQRRRGR